MQQGLSGGGRGDDREEGEVVDVQTRERHRVDLVDRGAQIRGVGDDVDQPRLPVPRYVFRGALVGEAHLLQRRQLDLHELDRHPAHRDLRAGHDRGGDQAHRLDRVLAGSVVDVGADIGLAVHAQRGGADALDPHPEPDQEEAQVLDHVVGAGVADHRLALGERRGQQSVLGDGVTALGEHYRAAGAGARGGRGLVVPLGRHHGQPEGPQRRHVRLDGAGAQIASTGVGELELPGAVHERPQEHDDAAGATSGLDIDGAQVEGLGHLDLEVVVLVQPPHRYTDRGQHLQQPVDLLDAGDLAQHGGAGVQQRGAQQGHSRVLARLDVDGAAEGGLPLYAQMARTGGAEADELGIQGGADLRDGLESQVLLSLLDTVDRALTGVQLSGQLGLGETGVLAGVTDQSADTRQVVLVLGHEGDAISQMRYGLSGWMRRCSRPARRGAASPDREGRDRSSPEPRYTQYRWAGGRDRYRPAL